jgi:hypothetical protein
VILETNLYILIKILVNEDDISVKGEYYYVNRVAEMNVFDLKRTNHVLTTVMAICATSQKGKIFISVTCSVRSCLSRTVFHIVIYICGTFRNEKL